MRDISTKNFILEEGGILEAFYSVAFGNDLYDGAD